MSLMLDEIRQQPEGVHRALASQRASALALAEQVREKDIHSVIIAARGTSDNAAIYAKYLFEIVAGIPVSLAAPSVYTLYGSKMRLDHTLVLGISQSGQGTDVVEVLAVSKEAGAITACITNQSDSPITAVSDTVLLCDAGSERSVAATKTYTTALAVIAMLIGYYAGESEMLESLHLVPDEMVKVLEMEPRILAMVERFRYMEECVVLARGVNQCTAFEAALKLTETCYMVAKPYSGADFLHGPIAVIKDGFPCFLFAPPGAAFAFMLDLARRLKERNAEMVILSSEEAILGLAQKRVQIPTTLPELLSPLVYVLPAQLFAHGLSQTRGLNPDHPRGLSKVTITK